MNTSEKVFVQLFAYGCVAILSGLLAAHGVFCLARRWMPSTHPA